MEFPVHFPWIVKDKFSIGIILWRLSGLTYHGSIISKDGGWTEVIKSRTAKAQGVFFMVEKDSDKKEDNSANQG